MFKFFANIFGYILYFIYGYIPNYGIAIILFTVLVKLLLLPFNIKQQKSMIINQKINDQMKVIQLKYKNNPEKQSQEMMKLYKENKVNPFSGLIVGILQFLLIISMFMLARQPLTYMEKIPQENISLYVEQLKENDISVSPNYPEIDIIRESDFLKQKFPEDENLNKIDLNMKFLGIDLAMIPQNNLNNWRVYIIPAIYIITIFIQNHLMTKQQQKLMNVNRNKEDQKLEKSDDDMMNSMNQMNSMMKYMMPVISITIVLVAPLGLALYWATSNICMIVERLVIDNIYFSKEKSDGKDNS